jgi:hypothetical protein
MGMSLGAVEYLSRCELRPMPFVDLSNNYNQISLARSCRDLQRYERSSSIDSKNL